MSGLSLGDCPVNNSSLISGQFGLQVIVIKKSGNPNRWTYAIPSWIRACMYRELPEWLESNTTLFPTESTLISLFESDHEMNITFDSKPPLVLPSVKQCVNFQCLCTHLPGSDEIDHEIYGYDCLNFTYINRMKA